MTVRPKISAFLVCCNEERNIRRALDSIKWCDEIVVIDSGSTDETLSICREYTDKIITRQWPGYVEQKRFGLSQCSNEWVFNIDADEEVSSDLRDDVLQVLSNRNEWAQHIKGYEIPRVVFYLGRWWRKGGWYPEYRLRLVRKDDCEWAGTDPHERATVNGQVARLKGELLHYTYHDMADHVRSLNSHSSVAAMSMFEKGKRTSLLKIAFGPPARFIKFFLVRRGFLEGIAGLIVAHFEAYYVFLKYAKLWELQRKSNLRQS